MLSNDELEAIRVRAGKATPGPWYAALTDDDLCMNACYVTTKRSRFEHDNRLGMSPGGVDHESVVCITLLQHPRLACHKAECWDEDADFIANARQDVPALLKSLDELQLYNEELNSLAGLQDMRIDRLEYLLTTIARHPSLLNVKMPLLENQTVSQILQSGDTDDITSVMHFIENGAGE
jgi:hypothetical protein